jgi:hypothetical protein
MAREPNSATTWKSARAGKARRWTIFLIARISSFLKSYGETTKGEQFVMQQVRAQAWERIRWIAALGLIVVALLAARRSA